MPFLRAEVYLTKKEVILKILEQEHIFKKGEHMLEHITFRTSAMPELVESGVVYLCGSSSRSIAKINFLTQEAARAYATKLHEGLILLNSHFDMGLVNTKKRVIQE